MNVTKSTPNIGITINTIVEYFTENVSFDKCETSKTTQKNTEGSPDCKKPFYGEIYTS